MALPQGLSLRRCQRTQGECQETANQGGKEQFKICSVFSLTPNPVLLPECILAAGCSWKAFAISALIVVRAAHIHIGLQVWSDALLPHPIVLFCSLWCLATVLCYSSTGRGEKKQPQPYWCAEQEQDYFCFF